MERKVRQQRPFETTSEPIHAAHFHAFPATGYPPLFPPACVSHAKDGPAPLPSVCARDLMGAHVTYSITPFADSKVHPGLGSTWPTARPPAVSPSSW